MSGTTEIDEVEILTDIGKLSEVLSAEKKDENIIDDSVAVGINKNEAFVSEYLTEVHTLDSTLRSVGTPLDCHSDQQSVRASQRGITLKDDSLCATASEILDDEIPANLENCLALNRAYQEIIDENLAKMRALLVKNQQCQTNLIEHIADPTYDPASDMKGFSHVRTSNWCSLIHNYFRLRKFGAPPHEHANLRRQRREYAYQRSTVIWTVEDRYKLAVGVLQDTARRRLYFLEQRRIETACVASCGDTGNTTAAAANVQSCDAAELQKEIERCKVADVDLEPPETALKSVDWNQISFDSLDGMYSHMECLLQWCNWLHPSILHGGWQEDEKKSLLSLSETISKELVTPAKNVRGPRNPDRSNTHDIWVRVCNLFATKRTPLDVFQHWMYIQSNEVYHKWTVVETNRLHRVVKALGLGCEMTSWWEVSYYMPERTPQQCRVRYRMSAQAGRFGRFTDAEDQAIIVAVECARIADFRTIARLLHRHNRAAVIEMRYKYYLRESLEVDEWTREQDEALVRQVWEIGPLWNIIAERVTNGTHSGIMCRNRFVMISKCFKQNGGHLNVDGPILSDTATQKRLLHNKKVRAAAFENLSNLEQCHTLSGESLFKAFVQKYCGDSISASTDALSRDEEALVRANSRSTDVLHPSSRPMKNVIMVQSPEYAEIGQLGYVRANRLISSRCVIRTDVSVCADYLRVLCLALSVPLSIVSDSDLRANHFLMRHSAHVQHACDILVTARDSPLHHTVAESQQCALLPVTLNWITAYRGLMLMRPHLEQQLVEGAVERRTLDGRVSRRDRRMYATLFSRHMIVWAQRVIVRPGTSLSVQPCPQQPKRHSHLVTVVVKYGSGTVKELRMRMARSDVSDENQLREKLSTYLRDIISIEILPCVPRNSTASNDAQSTAHGVSRSAIDPASVRFRQQSWLRLMSRFVGMFLLPSLMSTVSCRHSGEHISCDSLTSDLDSDNAPSMSDVLSECKRSRTQ